MKPERIKEIVMEIDSNTGTPVGNSIATIKQALAEEHARAGELFTYYHELIYPKQNEHYRVEHFLKALEVNDEV